MQIKKSALTGAFAAVSLISTFAVCEKISSRGNNLWEPDFLIILGCRVKGDEPQETLKMRIDAAAKYLEIHKNVIAVCCGGIVHDDQTKSEAQAIFEGLCKRGIEEGRLILEDKSKTTAENFINAKKIIDKIKLEKTPEIAFLSSEFHLLRASIIGKKVGVYASSVPAPSPKKLRFRNYAREFFVFPEALFKRSEKTAERP